MYIYISGLAVNGVRRSNNACSRSLLCSLFEIERVRILFTLFSLFPVRTVLCSRCCSQLEFCSHCVHARVRSWCLFAFAFTAGRVW